MRAASLAALLVLVMVLLPIGASADTLLNLEFSPGLPGWNQLYTPTFLDCDYPGVCFKGNLGVGQVLTLPGGTYMFSFLAKTSSGDPGPLLYLWWNSVLTAPTSTEQVGNHTQFTYSGLVALNGNNTLVLGFSGGCGCVKWNINTPPDDVVPEPATLVLLGSGLASTMAAGARRRRRRNAIG
jgi:hypothetical protein